MKTLHLNLRRKWFEMILSGEKTEEYRDIKEYWGKQLLKIFIPPTHIAKSRCMYGFKYLIEGDYEGADLKESTGGSPFFEDFDTITFSNGYAKDRDQFVIEFSGIEIKEGNPDWGAEKGEKYFVLSLGKILSKTLK